MTTKKKTDKPKPLTPPDLKRCQHEHLEGSFMTIGHRSTIRCPERAIYVAREIKPGPDGQHGEMSLCEVHWDEIQEKMPGACTFRLIHTEIGVMLSGYEQMQEILWPLEDPDQEWEAETIEHVAAVVDEAGFGPREEEAAERREAVLHLQLLLDEYAGYNFLVLAGSVVRLAENVVDGKLAFEVRWNRKKGYVLSGTDTDGRELKKATCRTLHGIRRAVWRVTPACARA